MKTSKKDADMIQNVALELGRYMIHYKEENNIPIDCFLSGVNYAVEGLLFSLSKGDETLYDTFSLLNRESFKTTHEEIKKGNRKGN